MIESYRAIGRPAEERNEMDEPSENGQQPTPAPAPERRLTREDKVIYWSVAIALLILTPLVLYIAFKARTGL